eukprot:COSAG04_NODE_8704_length_941_cov_1.030879_2_plen_92_part_00
MKVNQFVRRCAHHAQPCQDLLRAFEQGIRTNAVAPGWVDTKMVRGYREINDRAEDPHGTPEQIANVVLFLAPDEASWVNGAIVPADGGSSA